jgi:hypothetical protein
MTTIGKKRSAPDSTTTSSSIPPPGDGENYEQIAKTRECAEMSEREVQGLAANWLLKKEIREKDAFVPLPEFLWLISAGIKSGKTQMMIGAVRKIHRLYYRIYFLSPQRTLEAKVRSHLLPLVYNKASTEYTPANLAGILTEMKEVRNMTLATRCGAKATLAQRAARGDEAAYKAMVVQQLFGGTLISDIHAKMSAEERYDRDKLLATQGRMLLIMDDATLVKELKQRGDANTSFMGNLVRMRHEGIDMIIVVHNRGNVDTVLKNSATVDTLFNPRSPADKRAVSETTSGLSEKGLEALVKMAQSTSQHGTVTLYKGAPPERAYAINLNTFVELGWDDKEPVPVTNPEAPKPEWAPERVTTPKMLSAGKRLWKRIDLFEKGDDPDGKPGAGLDNGLLSNAAPGEENDKARYERLKRQRRRNASRWVSDIF